VSQKNTIKKIVKHRKNTVKKIGKRVVTLGQGKTPIPLPSGHSHAEPVGHGPSARGPPPDAAFIDASQLLARFGGRSHMWLVRLLVRDPTFPRPVKIGKLRFFRIDDLTAWERTQAAQSRAV
jgi:predicted DNA-binding transcriptional regulator AlpA